MKYDVRASRAVASYYLQQSSLVCQQFDETPKLRGIVIRQYSTRTSCFVLMSSWLNLAMPFFNFEPDFQIVLTKKKNVIYI